MLKRDIVFRGKRVDNGQWVEGFYSNLYNEEKCEEQSIITYQNFYAADMSYPYPSVNTVEAEVDPETVGQFTGMTDKNGTKIFEGDIVKEQYKSHEIIYNVYWDEDYFAFRVKSKDYSYYLDELVPSNSEVIGNIHDNKELLK